MYKTYDSMEDLSECTELSKKFKKKANCVPGADTGFWKEGGGGAG